MNAGAVLETVNSEVMDQQKGSVTNALDQVSMTGEMSPRLYKFLRQRLTELIAGRLSTMPGISADIDDIQQEVAIDAYQAAANQRFNSRQDFAAFCVKITKARIVDVARREFAEKRGGGQKHLPAEVLENVAGGNSVSDSEREVCEELVGLAMRSIDPNDGEMKEYALGYWISNQATAEEVQAAVNAQFPTKQRSSRTISRWIEDLRCKVYNAWTEKYGKPTDDELMEMTNIRPPRRKGAVC